MPGPLESETCRDVVLPALRAAGWSDDQIIAEYYVKAGRFLTSGGVQKRLGSGEVDYVLEIVPGLPVAVVEAKRAHRKASEGLAQALRYGQQLDVPVAYSTNGEQLIEHDFHAGTERIVDSYRPPAQLWSDYCDWRGLDPSEAGLLQQPFNRNKRLASGKVAQLRWYQQVAVNRVLTAIAKGDTRLLLLMATGTGKTFTAMQIVQKLRAWNALTNPLGNYRVLYLADRDALVTQPMDKDFGIAFGREPLGRVLGGNTGKSRDVVFATYQALESGRDDSGALSQYPPDFFDLVIVDECHRGSAADDSSWRAVLDHFSSAVQLGLTATPKQDETVDTYRYFGDPIFSYSLRQGIADGYLAPYRVRRVVLSPDDEGWEPEWGERDVNGVEIPAGVYTTRDFERVVRLRKRTELATTYLMRRLRDKPGRMIVFCYDIEHAEQMRRDMVAAAPDWTRQDAEWVVRITGDEGEKERLIKALSDPELDSPMVATTSRLLSTGIDVEDLHYVVLLRPVGSAVEFKQIIGRGTRLYPEKGKTSFEIIDFVGATLHFSDPDFDGFPMRVQVDTVDSDGDVVDSSEDPDQEVELPDPEHLDGIDSVAEPAAPFTAADPVDIDGTAGPIAGATARERYVVADGNFHLVAEILQVPDTSTGKLRLTEIGEYVASRVHQLAPDPAALAALWADPDGRAKARTMLEAAGVDLAGLPGSPDVDPYDVLVHLAWNQPARTRAERARRVRETYHAEIERMSTAAREVINSLIERYSANGIDDALSPEALNLPPISMLGSRRQVIGAFGGAEGWHQAVTALQEWIYSTETAS